MDDSIISVAISITAVVSTAILACDFGGFCILIEQILESHLHLIISSQWYF